MGKDSYCAPLESVVPLEAVESDGFVRGGCRWNWWGNLQFADPGVEADFGEYRIAKVRRRQRKIAWAILLISMIFIILDALVTETIRDTLPWRLAQNVAVVLYIASQYHPRLERMTGKILVFLSVAYSIPMLVVLRIIDTAYASAAPMIIIAEVMVLLIASPHKWHVMAVSATMISYLVDHLLFSNLPPLWVVCGFSVAVAAGVVILFAGYYMEKSRRRTFLSLRQIKLDIDTLEGEEIVNKKLLANVFPKEIVSRLKVEETHSLVDGYDSVTCLFLNIHGVHEYAESAQGTGSVRRLVATLNDLFCAFDAQLGEHHVEKIKTVRSTYFAVAGCPRISSRHADNALMFAFNCRRIVEQYNADGGAMLAVQVGLNTGSVVAGVVGRHRFVFDLWGDTVNVASRMASHAPVGSIQVSLATRSAITVACTFHDQGAVAIKGRGRMRTYLVEPPSSNGFLAPTEWQRVSLLKRLEISGTGSDLLLSARSRSIHSVASARSSVQSVKSAQLVEASVEIVKNTKSRAVSMSFVEQHLEQEYRSSMWDDSGMHTFRRTTGASVVLLLAFAVIDLVFFIGEEESFLVAVPTVLLASGPAACLVLSFLVGPMPPGESLHPHMSLLAFLSVITTLSVHTAALLRVLLFPGTGQYLFPGMTQTALIHVAASIHLRWTWALLIELAFMLILMILPFVVHMEQIMKDVASLNVNFVATAIFALLSRRVAEHSLRKDFLLSGAVAQKRKLIAEQRQKSEALLLNVLPSAIITVLREGEMVIAQEFNGGSLLVCDIVGFTVWASTLSPHTIVSFLNELFHRLDDLCDKWDCEKIKTIGDAYVVGAGLLSSRLHAARRLCMFGLEMHLVMDKVCAATGHALSLRCGVHSGSFVGGVVGSDKFAWDLWGSAVDRAFELEDEGVPKRVHISEATYALVTEWFDVEVHPGTSEHTTFLITNTLDATENVSTTANPVFGR